MKENQINPTVLAQMFDDLATHGWAQSDELVATGWASEIAHECQSLYSQNAFTQAAVGHGSTKHVQTQIRGDSTLWLEEAPASPVTDSVRDFLQEILQELNQSLYLGLKRFEAHFAYYPAGAGYQKHIDNHKGLSHRRITFVFYLNESWSASDGGELSLYSPEEPDKKTNSIQPRLGNILLFRSELFPHQVEESFKPRKSLTGWFRDDAL